MWRVKSLWRETGYFLVGRLVGFQKHGVGGEQWGGRREETWSILLIMASYLESQLFFFFSALQNVWWWGKGVARRDLRPLWPFIEAEEIARLRPSSHHCRQQRLKKGKVWWFNYAYYYYCGGNYASQSWSFFKVSQKQIFHKRCIEHKKLREIWKSLCL